MKEINALSEVIAKKINQARKDKLQGILEKDREYLKLVKDVEAFNKEVAKLVEVQSKFQDKVESIKKRLKLEVGEGNGIGYLSVNSVFNSWNKDYQFSIHPTINSISYNNLTDKLILKNIGGDLDVNKFIDEMVKELGN